MKTTRTHSSAPDRSAFRRRMRVLSACLGVGFAVVAGRLFQLQVVRAEHYRDLARKGLTTQRLEPAPRVSDLRDQAGELRWTIAAIGSLKT